MYDDFIKKNKRHHVREIPLAPILDLLVVVIFFLVLSASFTEFTKQTIPPVGVNTITGPATPPPLTPKIFAVRNTEGNMRIFLRWSGLHPGQNELTVTKSDGPTYYDQLMAQSEKLVEVFKSQYSTQSSLQVGFGSDVTYQEMISMMDGIRTTMSDLALTSYTDAEAFNQGTSSQ